MPVLVTCADYPYSRQTRLGLQCVTGIGGTAQSHCSGLHTLVVRDGVWDVFSRLLWPSGKLLRSRSVFSALLLRNEHAFVDLRAM